jgi:hypothetical protein
MTDIPGPAAAALIDFDRTACLCDAGQPDYLAATAVSEDGSTHLLLAELGDVRTTTNCGAHAMACRFAAR